MARKSKSKNGHCISYQMPIESARALIGHIDIQISDEFKVRELRQVTVASLTSLMEKYYSAYVYAAWHGKNAEILRLVDLSSGEILEERKYYTRDSLLTLQDKLESQQLAMFVY